MTPEFMDKYRELLLQHPIWTIIITIAYGIVVAFIGAVVMTKIEKGSEL